MSLTKNPNVNQWVDEMIALCKPEKSSGSTAPRNSWIS